jgi:serine/threonine-protein kinase
VGKDCNTASSGLDAIGLGAKCVEGNAAPDQASVGKVYTVSPTGNVPLGTIVQLTVYAGQTPMPNPAAPTFQGSPASVPPGGPVTVTWTGYTCPAGTGSVSSYTLTVTNGTAAGGPSYGPDVRSAQITAGPSGTLIVKYNVTCSGGTAGSRTSADSGEANLPIVAPPPPQTPTPTPTTP